MYGICLKLMNMKISDTKFYKRIAILSEFLGLLSLSLQYFPDLLRQKPSHVRGLISSRGDYWKFSRQILSPTFSTSKMKMVSIIIQI